MQQKILCVDDSRTMHRLIAAFLQAPDLLIRFAETASDAMAQALSDTPDLILLDIGLPDDASGYELFRAFRQRDALQNTPIIFVSGHNQPEQRARGLNMGAFDYIGKPFHPGEFLARVRAALRTKFLVDLLKHRAQIDSLTGLRNRGYLDQRVAHECALLRRRPGLFSCIMVDIDHFKHINDSYGHVVGDDVIRAAARVIEQNIREEDLVCRYGGEEFVVFTPGVSLEGATTLAERLRAMVADLSIPRPGGTVRVTASFGVADYANAAERLVEAADSALYESKHQGRNRVTPFNPLACRINFAA